MVQEKAKQCLHQTIEDLNPSAFLSEKIQSLNDGIKVCGQVFPLSHDSTIWVMATGKASIGMTEAALKALETHADKIKGMVLCHGEPKLVDPRIKVRSTRPLGKNAPTEKGLQATKELCQILDSTQKQDVILFLISGGTSAMLHWPEPDFSFEETESIVQHMLKNNYSIDRLNFVRSTFDKVKRGGLLHDIPYPERVTALAISDVPGDQPSVIGSGPLHPISDKETERAKLQKILSHDSFFETYKDRILECYERKATLSGSPPPFHILSSNQKGVEALKNHLSAAFPYAWQVGSFLDQPVGDCKALIMQSFSSDLDREEGIIWGGEPTVELPANIRDPRGGRVQHLGLLVLEELLAQDEPFIWGGIATDGEDGHSDSAGFCFAPSEDAPLDLGLLDSVQQALKVFCSGTWFEEHPQFRVRTGPTGTNVMDLFFLCKLPPNPSC